MPQLFSLLQHNILNNFMISNDKSIIKFIKLKKYLKIILEYTN